MRIKAVTVAILALAVLAGCKDDKPRPQPQPQPGPGPTSEWIIGPIIGGKNYSVNMPPTLDAAQSFTFPSCGQGSVHYVTKANGPISGTMRLRYRLEGVSGLQPILAQPVPGAELTGSLYFETYKVGNWTAAEASERWYHAGNVLNGDGEFTVEAPLQIEYWGDAMGGKDKGAFETAINTTARVGFVFGHPGSGNTGHGGCGNGRFYNVDFSAAP